MPVQVLTIICSFLFLLKTSIQLRQAFVGQLTSRHRDFESRDIETDYNPARAKLNSHYPINSFLSAEALAKAEAN